jgi:ubiquinone biosynthesis protein COQ9
MDLSAPSFLRATNPVRRDTIAAALRVGQRAGSWDAVHVHTVAAEAGITLAELATHFEGKDDIAEGFFDEADEALLSICNHPAWRQWTIRERLQRAMMTWLEALGPHRRLVIGMLGYKLHPEHVHLQARGVARISRTVQWIREVAMLPSTGWRRELEEAVLTSIYLATFSCWLTDTTPGHRRTRWLLKTLLSAAERGSERLPSHVR